MNRFSVKIVAFAVLIFFVSIWFAAVLQGSEDPSPVVATRSGTPQDGALVEPEGEAILRLPGGGAVRARREDVVYDERGRPAQIVSRVQVAAGG